MSDDKETKKKPNTKGIKTVIFLLFGAALYEIYSRTPMFERLNKFIREI